MKSKGMLFAIACAALVIAGGYGLYRLGMDRGMSMGSAIHDGKVSPTPAEPGKDATPAGPMSIAQGEDATRRHLKDGIKAGDVDPANGKRILYYHDPMMPGKRFEKPAKSL